MKYIFLITFSSIFISANAQIIREKYEASASYDLKISKDSSVGGFSHFRVFHNGENDFVIIEELSNDEKEVLSLEIIDFKHGTHLLLNDKTGSKALLTEFKRDNLARTELIKEGESRSVNGISLTTASMTVEGMPHLKTKLEMSGQIDAPSYLQWHPEIDHDLDGHFPVSMEHYSENDEGIKSRLNYKAENFRTDNAFHFATFDLDIEKKRK